MFHLTNDVNPPIIHFYHTTNEHASYTMLKLHGIKKYEKKNYTVYFAHYTCK